MPGCSTSSPTGPGPACATGFSSPSPPRSPSAGVATLRYQFPYMEAGSGRPDPPAVARGLGARGGGARRRRRARSAAHRRRQVARRPHDVRRGRRSPLPGVRGLVFLGFPLHPPGQPGITRADHLDRVDLPMLFLQGTRDTFAQLDLLTPVIERLGASGHAPPGRGRRPLLRGAQALGPHAGEVHGRAGRHDRRLGRDRSPLGSQAMSFDPTPQQRKAIEAPLGPVLVVAGPGAGKTYCLIGRVQHLIQHWASPRPDLRRHLHQQGGGGDRHPAERHARAGWTAS